MKRMSLLFVITLCLTIPMFAQMNKMANCLNREDATKLLFEDASGVIIDPIYVKVWSPFVDFGFGAGFEGLLPKGTVIDPAYLGVEPYPGESIELDQPAYFFWIDDEAINGSYTHPTRFVLLTFNCESKTFQPEFSVSIQGWWPVITTLDGGTQSYFEFTSDRVSNFPAGYNNPDGYISGSPTLPLAEFNLETPVLDVEEAQTQTNNTSYGLVILGSGDFASDATQHCQNLTSEHGVPPANIVKSNNGGVTNKSQLDAAITALCALGAGACTKIHVRIVSHGGKGELILGGDTVHKDSLCKRFESLAAKKVPICYVIDACYSGSLMDDNMWNAPPGSSVVTSSDSLRRAWKGNCLYLNGDTTKKVTGLIFTDAFIRCQKDKAADKNKDKKVDNCEAYDWVKAKKPCYGTKDGAHRVYPDGPPAGTTPDPRYPNPKPQKTKIKALKVKVLDGVNQGTIYNAPGNTSIKLQPKQHISLSVPETALDIFWTVNGEPISVGQGEPEIERQVPYFGGVDFYVVSYVYGEEEYTFSMEIIGGPTISISGPIYDKQGQKLLTEVSTYSVQKIYPNPFVHAFQVDVFSKNKDQLDIRLLDLNGRSHYQRLVETEKGLNTIMIKPSQQLSKGLYFLEVINTQGQKIVREITLM